MNKFIKSLSLIISITLGIISCKAQVISTDSTPPAKLDENHIQKIEEDSKVTFIWVNPIDEDFAGVKILYDDDEIIIKSSKTTVLIENLENNKEYSFQFITFDGSNNQSSPVIVNATPKDLIAPAEVSNININTAENNVIVLEWQNPNDTDLMEVVISCDDETVFPKILTKEVQIVTFSNLTNGKTYTFIFMTKDNNGNISTGITKQVTVQDTNPPSPVTNVITTPGDEFVKLNWTNPTDSDFAKVEIEVYSGNKKVNKVTTTSEAETSKTISDLTNYIEYTFKIYSVDYDNNYTTGNNIYITRAIPRELLTDGPNWQGSIAKENLEIEGIKYEKTKEIVIVPNEKFAIIDMKDDSDGNNGVFLEDRKVILSPFVMSAYEVTQELYEAVMGNNPTNFFDSNTVPIGDVYSLRPVEGVCWFDCILFCNELTKKTMGVNECVYYCDSQFKSLYTLGDGYSVYVDRRKKGYRLPTECEWEYAARGGNPCSIQWNYNYSGTELNTELCDYAWYNINSGNVIHEVGKKKPNMLGLYDMSGNVMEWCYDLYGQISIPGTIEIDPLGMTSSFLYDCVLRGGSLYSEAGLCYVYTRRKDYPSNQVTSAGFDVRLFQYGFRLVRSL